MTHDVCHMMYYGWGMIWCILDGALGMRYGVCGMVYVVCWMRYDACCMMYIVRMVYIAHCIMHEV